MVEINNKAGYELDIESLRQVVFRFLKHYQKENLEVSIALVDDEEIRNLNKVYRGKNLSTDVLSFPADKEDLVDNFLGEVIINYQEITRQAQDFGQSPEKELVFILVHGLLHLLGHQDQTQAEREKMIQVGQDVIKRLNLSI